MDLIPNCFLMKRLTYMILIIRFSLIMLSSVGFQILIKKKTEFWYVICDKKMDLQEYSRNTRSKIRRGLKQCGEKN